MKLSYISPDIRRRIKDRLLALPPRAFELFAGDLLTFMGLQHVVVTGYLNDGGIDASGEVVDESGFICVPTGVQVKRHRKNVQRSDIDRFIGALGGRFHHGIFITTADYAPQAREKAQSSPLMRIDTISGNAVAALMRRHLLGLTGDDDLDEDYFLTFEAHASHAHHPYSEPLSDEEANASRAVTSDEDLISLRALSYLLRVDTTTIRNWVEQGKLFPDLPMVSNPRQGMFFRRNRVDEIRAALVRVEQPRTSAQWRQAFLDFTQSRHITRSYKPVLIKALLAQIDHKGEASFDAVVRAFHAFYLERHQRDLVAEFRDSILAHPGTASHAAVRRLVIRYPLDRFIIQGFLEYDPATDVVRFAPPLWAELRASEVLAVLEHAEEQLNAYYARSSA